MTDTPLIYSHPALYRGLMRVVYGRHLRDRYVSVAAEVPAGASVVEVCAGDCRLYTGHLREKRVAYRALDLSEPFVRHARGLGIDARVHDLACDDIPPADVVVLQGSLYQFIPRAREVLTRLRGAARVKLIVSEPVRNFSSSPVPLLAWVSRRLTRAPARFDEGSLAALFRSVPGLERTFFVPGGRELVGVFRGGAK